MSLSSNRFFYTNTNHNDASNVLVNYNNLTGNHELIQHPLNKYARELFFSPSYNNVFFNSINWANSLGKYKNQNNLINPLVSNVLMNIDILDDTISYKSIISHIVKMGHINGELAGDNIGWSISSNDDGTIVAIGAYSHAPGGIVSVYEWNGSTWEKMGSDIDAEASGDLFGMSVSLSANGKIFASGGYSNAGSGPAAGHARVYEWNGTTWVQMGSDIDAEAPGDRSGITISLSADGKIVAVGARENDGTTNNTNDNRGHVRVYKWNNSSWQQIGNDIDGEAGGDESGGSYYSNNVSLNANGTIVAIGATYNDGGAQDSGHVRVYDYDETRNPQWKQLGDDIDGEVKDDWFGNSVSLSADGTILAIGAPRHDTAGDKAGRVYVYKYNGNIWEIIGTFDGEAANDQYGMCVSLNNDGTILAIGAPHNNSKGHVRIYQYLEGVYASDWIQVGYDIEGEGTSDEFGHAVSLSKDGSVLVVSAVYDDNTGVNAGSVYTYELIKQSITSIVKMGTPISGYPHESGQFGFSVSSNADGTIIAISSILRDIPLFDSGGVYIYKWEGNNWNNIGYIGGEGYYDQFGNSVSLNGDGTRVAIGSKANYGVGGARSGHVRVHEYNGSTWDQLGQDIDGENTDDNSGHSVSLSDDGSIVAIAAPQHDGGKGHVRVYKWDGSSWQQRGNDIDGEAAGDESGQSISLSADGTIVAIGSHKNNSSRGHVRVHKWDGSNWQQIGDDIDGEGGGDNSGWSISLSSNGKILAIGAIKNDGINGADSGHVRVYDYDENREPAWKQMGSDIDGESSSHYGDWSGFSVSLSGDGTIVAIGARLNDVDPATDSNIGSARVYQYVKGLYASDWVQIGDDIDGEASGDHFGYSISLSKNGSTLVIGTPYNSGNTGRAYMYQLIEQPLNKSIIKMGEPINGEAANDQFGYCVSSNADGTVIAAAAPFNDDSEIDSGNVRIYKYIKVNEEPIIYQSWKISDVTSNSMIIGTGPWMPNHEVYVKVTPVNAGNKFRLRFQGGSGNYEIKDIRIAKYIPGRDSALFSNFDPWYTISVDGASGETFVSIPANGQKWTDWINAPIEANTPYLVYFKYHASRDYYSYWTTSTTNSWVNGSEENRVYNIDLMEVKYSDGRMQMGNTIYGENVNDYSGHSISLNADGTIIAIGAKMQYSNASFGSVAGHVRLFKYFEPNNDVNNYNDHTYFGIIPTRRSSNKYWAFYSYKITQSGVDIVYFNGSNYNNLIWNSSTLPSGPHGWGWQYSWEQGWTNTATPLWYVKTDATIDGTPLTFELINYDQNHTPLSGNFVSASSPNGPWVVRDSWSLNSPLTTVGSTPTSGYKIISDLNPRWIQMGNDIDGQDARDYFGTSVSLNGDGTIVAIGAYMHNSTTGHVRIYEWDGSSWQKMGSDIDGKGVNRDRCGYSVSFSADEKIVAIGSPYNNDAGNGSGHTRIYKYINDTWTQLGLDINGEASNDESGHSVSLNADGTIVAIGAPFNDGGGTNSGHVRIYNYDENREPAWKQMGSTIVGEGASDQSGRSVSLSSDGMIVAIGAIYNDGNGVESGHVRVYKYNGSIWEQIGADIDGEAAGDRSGISVSLSKNGSTLIVGANQHDNIGINSGRVYTYEIVDIGNTVETNTTKSTPTESLSVTFDGDILGNVDSNTVLYAPKGQLWHTTGIGPYRYNKFLLDVHIPGNYVASTWIGTTLSDGNVVETVMNERTRVWMIIIEGQETHVDLVGWNLVNDYKYFIFRNTTNTSQRYPYVTPIYNRIFEAGTTYLDNSIALFVFENIDDTVV